MRLILMISRVVLSVAMLGYASYKDVKTREVSDALWLLFGSIGLLIDGYAIITGMTGWSTILVSIGFSTAFSLLAGYLGFFGGADLLAFIVIGVLNPIPPQVGFESRLVPPFTISTVSDLEFGSDRSLISSRCVSC